MLPHRGRERLGCDARAWAEEGRPEGLAKDVAEARVPVPRSTARAEGLEWRCQLRPRAGPETWAGAAVIFPFLSVSEDSDPDSHPGSGGWKEPWSWPAWSPCSLSR